MSIFSFAESFSDPRYDPYDISRYVDRVSPPLRVLAHKLIALAGTHHCPDSIIARASATALRQARRSSIARHGFSRRIQGDGDEESLAQLPERAREGQSIMTI
jgi:hypothetical protein